MQQPTPISRSLFGLGLALSLLLLLWHSWESRFFTDDAFIAFRYARNLADGHGLVFNPGFEAVEGFSSPLWVLLLALFARLGLEPPNAALGLSALATLVLWAGLLQLTRRTLPAGSSPHWALLPLGLLSLTRSVAVWSSGGLETRFFEALVICTLLALLRELDRERARQTASRIPLGGLLLGCLAWTRPEGALLIFTMPLAVALLGPRDRSRLSALGRTFCSALLLLCFLFAARLWLFGEWLPNTYYAKLDGRSWWSMGLAYLAMFSLEYAAWSWLPLCLWGALRLGRSSSALQLVLGLCLPLLVYSVAIGGDHFEYRPLDLFMPYAYWLLTLGAQQLWHRPSLRIPLGAWLLLATLGIWSLPRASKSNYPEQYQPGFPGLVQSTAAASFPRAEQGLLYGLPGFAQLARWHRQLLQHTSKHFVGLRMEEHRLFLAQVREHAGRLRRLVDSGRLPAETHIAIDCVGAIPYLSDLRVLDRLGLTDAEVARSGFVRAELSAHGKYAKSDLAQRRGVDLWAVHPSFLLWESDSLEYRQVLEAARAAGQELGLAEVEPGWVLLAWLPQGLAAAQARLPKLGLRSSLP